MPYSVEFEEEAVQDLQRHDPALQSLILDEIERLAADPVRLSRRGAFPYPLYQRYPFRIDFSGHSYFFTALFQYDPDEARLWIKFLAFSST